jgi:hypothetical protein
MGTRGGPSLSGLADPRPPRAGCAYILALAWWRNQQPFCLEGDTEKRERERTGWQTGRAGERRVRVLWRYLSMTCGSVLFRARNVRGSLVDLAARALCTVTVTACEDRDMVGPTCPREGRAGAKIFGSRAERARGETRERTWRVRCGACDRCELNSLLQLCTTGFWLYALTFTRRSVPEVSVLTQASQFGSPTLARAR